MPRSAAPAAGDALDRDRSWLRELVPSDMPARWDARVVRYLEFYRDDRRGRSIAQAFLRRSARWATSIRPALRAHGVPEDLLWVALIESGFDPTARSPAGAAGLWQLMPEGARMFGLVVDRWVDERLDPARATDAAAIYLSDLYRRFGAWELALAGYNMGWGGLVAAIRKYNTNDYWELGRFEAGIPWETTLYVPKIVAASVVARNAPAFGLEPVAPDAEAAREETAEVPGGVTLRAVAAAAGVPLADVEARNPQIRAGRTPPDAPGTSRRWILRVPAGAGTRVLAAMARPGPSDAPPEVHVVRAGETADAIATARGVSKQKLAEANALQPGEVLPRGTVLVVPPAARPAQTASAAERPVVVVPAGSFAYPDRRRVFYRVSAGDALRDVADALGVEADDLCRWNAIDPGARLHDGMTLQAFVSPGADLSRAAHFAEDDVTVLVVGTEAFYAHFEALRGRRRVAVQVRPGDTWESLSRRHGLSVGMLERINRRSRTDRLAAGDTVVVYVASAAAVPGAVAKPDGADASGAEPAALGPLVAPRPEDLPPLPEAGSR